MRIFHISCPDYHFDDLDLGKVGMCIDDAMVNNFDGQKAVIRAIQSEKHSLPKEELIRYLVETGSDRYSTESKNDVQVNYEQIDLFGLACEIKTQTPICLKVLEGFHKWKPKSLERPQLKLDIWMVYDADKLEDVEYFHSHYEVMARDGYKFKDQNNKSDALLGIVVID